MSIPITLSTTTFFIPLLSILSHIISHRIGSRSSSVPYDDKYIECRFIVAATIPLKITHTLDISNCTLIFIN
jgi:hypothetical protein